MLTFMREALRDRLHTGAVLPSSPRLARAMTRSARIRNGPKRILEVGPGTGPFTRQLLKALGPNDELHIVEISPDFSRLIRKRLIDPYLRRSPDRTVRLYCHAIEDAPLEGQFEVIVCGLPFNNFPPTVVRRIFRILIERLAPGGELSYFEYAGVRAMKGSLVGGQGRRNLRRVGMTGRVLRRKHAGRRQLVFANLPPAMMVRLIRTKDMPRDPNAEAPGGTPTVRSNRQKIATKDAPLSTTHAPC